MRTRIQFAAVAVLALSTTLSGCSSPAEAAARHPLPVKVRTVERTPNASAARYSGYLEPAAKVDLAFRVGGYVESLAMVGTGAGRHTLDKGDYVKKGSVIGRIRSADYAQKVASASAQTSEALAQVKLAEHELERSRTLFVQRAVTQAELDSRTARAESAKAQYEAAAARAQDTGLSLGDTVLRAPMDGVVLTRSVEVGSLVAPGQPAISIADVRTVRAVFGAPQSLVEELAVGDSVTVFVGAETEAKAPEKLLDAKVTRIAPSADSNGRVFSVEATLPNDDGSLRPGAVVSVHIKQGAAVRGDVAVPLAAIVRSPKDPRGFSVFVLEGEGDRAVARNQSVRLGEVIGNDVTVLEGLTVGRRLVTVGATLVRDGSDVVVLH